MTDEMPVERVGAHAVHAADAAGSLTVREIAEAGLEEWGRAFSSGNFMPYRAESAERRKRVFEPGRWLGAYEGRRCVGTFRGISFDLSVPGGAMLPVAGISSISVVPTHRRRGLLKAMMAQGLRSAVARGEAAAVLHSAEYGVYGRYGFAPATRHGGFTVDVRAGRGLRPGPAGTGTLQPATMEDVRRFGPALFDRVRRSRAGAVSRPDWNWQARTGESVRPGEAWAEPTAVVYRDVRGQVSGLATYRVDGKWTDGVPDSTLTVTDLITTTPEALRALWQHLLSLDWVHTIDVPDAAPDDPAPLLLADARAVRPLPHPADCLWLRLLDLPAALTARTYATEGRLVLEVADPDGHVDGRWQLHVAADGSGHVTTTDDPAHLALDATTLAMLYLGGETAARLKGAGLVEELRPGAAATADALFRASLAPWCPDHF
ncbi:GNAT family N-acetyltransferase [Streptomyces altiplanensis]